MPFADMGQVQTNLPQFQLNSTSKPTLDAATEMLAETEARWRAALITYGYNLDTIDADPYAPLVLREHVVTCTIAKILTARAAAIGGDIALQSAADARTRCAQALAALAAGTLDIGVSPEDSPSTASDPLLDYSSIDPRASMDDLW